jgi:hypothetical protein
MRPRPSIPNCKKLGVGAEECPAGMNFFRQVFLYLIDTLL